MVGKVEPRFNFPDSDHPDHLPGTNVSICLQSCDGNRFRSFSGTCRPIVTKESGKERTLDIRSSPHHS